MSRWEPIESLTRVYGYDKNNVKFFADELGINKYQFAPIVAYWDKYFDGSRAYNSGRTLGSSFESASREGHPHVDHVIALKDRRGNRYILNQSYECEDTDAVIQRICDLMGIDCIKLKAGKGLYNPKHCTGYLFCKRGMAAVIDKLKEGEKYEDHH